MVATARTSGRSPASRSTAAPPRLWPTSNRTGWPRPAMKSQAARRSAALRAKWLSSNTPALSPRPVKSKRSTPSPWRVSASDTRRTTLSRLLPVKQWANTA